MQINPELIQFLVALLAGILIFIQPKLLSYIVAIFLIAFGTLGILETYNVL